MFFKKKKKLIKKPIDSVWIELDEVIDEEEYRQWVDKMRNPVVIKEEPIGDKIVAGNIALKAIHESNPTLIDAVQRLGFITLYLTVMNWRYESKLKEKDFDYVKFTDIGGGF